MTFRFLLAAAFVAALSHDNQGVTVSALLTPATNGAQTKNPMKNLDQSSSSSSATTGSDSFPGFLAQLAPYADMPLEHSITLPPRAYTDPDLFAMEKDTIFRPGWICVAHAAQLKNKGDFLTMDVMGERMVIVNNGDGNMEVMSRVCTHRWASICESGKGSCAKFTCPMHKWSFDLKGECVGTPYMEDVADFDKADHSLHKYRSETIGGFVYVNIDGTADSLAPQIAGLTDWMKNWETDKTELFFEELEYECDFNWKIMIETFMEAYHHMGPHQVSFEPNFPANTTYIEDPKPAYMVGHAKPRPGREEVAFDNGIPFFPKLDKKHEKEAFAFITVLPIHMVLVLPDAVIWHRVQPIAADKTLFQAFCLVPPETLEMENLDSVRKEYKEFMDQFNMEDITQNIAMQEGVEAGSARIGRLHSRLEAAVWQLNTFVTSKLSGKKLSP